MSIETVPSFVIKVLIAGRKDAVESPSYESRAAAEEDLVQITDARQSDGEIMLPWLTMRGDRVDAAFIEDQSIVAGFVSIDVAQEPW
jgi:hypothetical protein